MCHDGVLRTQKEAVAWLEYGAALDETDALDALGWALHEGHGVKRDRFRAEALWARSRALQVAKRTGRAPVFPVEADSSDDDDFWAAAPPPPVGRRRRSGPASATPARAASGNAYDSSDDDAPSPAPARVAETPVVKTA